MPEPVFEAAPHAWRLEDLHRLDTTAHGPLRALPTRRAWHSQSRKLTADGWGDLPFPRLWDRAEPVCIAAAADGVVFVDRRGALNKVDDTNGLHQLAPPWGGLIGLYGDEVRLVCDAALDRVVLWDGSARSTWAFSDEAWKRLAGPQPGGGEALLCPTPRGIYLLAGTDLWLLDGDRWEPVAQAHAGWRANLLWWSPRQDGLWALSDDAIEVWTTDGPRSVPAPPLPSVRRGNYYEEGWSQVVATGYDPVSNTLLWYMEYESVTEGSQYRTRSLSAAERTSVLRLDDCLLPEATLPLPRPGLFAAPPSERDSTDERRLRRSFYVIEFSIHLQGDQGFFYVAADRDEVRAVLDDQPADADNDTSQDWPDRYAFLDQGQTVCIWTVQNGILSAGLDVLPYLRIHNADGTIRSTAEVDVEDDSADDWDTADDEQLLRVSVDWDAVAAKLPVLRPPFGPPVDPGDDLDILVVGPHPAPQISTYLDFHLGEAVFEYGPNEL